MRRHFTRIALFTAGLAVVASTPVIGRLVRGERGPRCETDGAALDGVSRTRVVDGLGRAHLFCCVDCAHRFLDASSRAPAEFVVIDETTGAEIPAALAWYVRSPVLSCAASGCHVHVFAREADALRHVEAYGGLLLSGDERPFVRRD